MEELGPRELAAIAVWSRRLEATRREPPYDVFKWWGRRYAALSRAVLAGLVLRRGEETLLEMAARGEPPGIVGERARGLLVVDPFAGAGTIPLEAAYLGYDSLGIDILPSAVAVARASLETVGPGCRDRVWCLSRALARAWERVRGLWLSPLGVVVHVFLARCSGDACMVPVLLSVRRGREKRCLVIGEGGVEELSGEECGGLGPTRPLAGAPPGMLPEEAPGARAYAVEVLGGGGERRFIAYTSPEWPLVASWLRETLPLARGLAPRGCTLLPARGEAARLRGHGVECWEQVYTPRQLASLSVFAREADRLGCGWLARIVSATASRSSSLLAVYYQPAGKVNPGLVIKGYWLPRYPVELNPLGHRPSRTGPPLPLGRGGVASIVRKVWRACRGRPLPRGARIVFRVGDATRPESYPEAVDHVVTDPPYPGMQDYAGLSAIYDYWLGVSAPRRPGGGRDSTLTIMGMLEAVRSRLRRGGYLVMIIGSGINHVDRLIQVLRRAASLYGLRRVYWLPGESPGGLGRSRVRGVYIVVARRGAPHRRDALEPLGWVAEIAGAAGYRIDTGLELERTAIIRRALAPLVAGPA